MSSFIVLKNRSNERVSHKVSKEVSTYIKQLELYIRYPKQSKLMSVYGDRFKERDEELEPCPECGQTIDQGACFHCKMD